MERRKRVILPILIILIVSSITVLVIKVISSRNLSEESLKHSLENKTQVSQKIIDENIVSSGKNFKVFDVSKDDSPVYLYEIYNNLGKTVKSETIIKFPMITYSSDSLLSIEWGIGTDAWLTQYYDINKDAFSDIFESPLAVQDGKVVYVEYSDDFVDIKLVVRDIFDKSKYCKEIHLDDLALSVRPVKKVEFINDKQLNIFYVTGDDFEEKTQSIQLD